jgi:tRNA pseudouridine38-40 synthase
MRNIKLTLEYDGTAFHGWQVQPNRRTVQGLLVESLRTLFQEPVSIIGAGRTDAGVHARGQVANFTTKNKLPLREIHHRLNALLPSDVVVHRVRNVPLGFHARYDAVGRRYLYCLSTCPTALRRHVVWSLPYAVDATLMRDAAQGLLGTHDFSAFCIGSDQRAHCRCTVQEVSLKNRKGEIHMPWFVSSWVNWWRWAAVACHRRNSTPLCERERDRIVSWWRRHRVYVFLRSLIRERTR